MLLKRCTVDEMSRERQPIVGNCGQDLLQHRVPAELATDEDAVASTDPSSEGGY